MKDVIFFIAMEKMKRKSALPLQKGIVLQKKLDIFTEEACMKILLVFW